MMITNPIIPIWIMSIICAMLLILKRKGIIPYLRQIVVIALIFVINLRPMVHSDNVKSEITKVNAYVVFVIDDTLSMLADDYNGGSRLEGVYQDCEYIINELNGAKFSIITFNNEAQIIAPFSDDSSFVIDTIKSIYPLSSLYAQGTTLNVSKDIMTEVLKNARKKGDGQVILFYISDGEITKNNDELDSFKAEAEYVDGGAVMGYGTSSGGRMYYNDFYESGEYITEDYGEDAISKIDEVNLKSIADDIDIDYIKMSKSQDLDSVLGQVKNDVNSSAEIAIDAGYVDIYYWFVIPVALIMTYEVISFKRKV